MTRRVPAAAPALLALAALAGAGVLADGPSERAARAPRSQPLDIAPDFAPVLSAGTLRLFTRTGRNQLLAWSGEEPPQCSPVPIETAVQPVACAGAVFALDESGALWKLGGGFPRTVDQLPPGALALLAGEPLPAVLYADFLRLPGGGRAPLPFPALGGCPVAAGWWVYGEARAALLRGDGTAAWTWAPQGLHPRLACVSGDRCFAGTAEGLLVALDAATGAPRFQYRCGGEVVRPLPLPGGGVLFTSFDHSVRRLTRAGQLLWQARLGGRLSFGALLVPGGVLAAEQAGRRVALFDLERGKLLWRWDAPEGEILLAPAAQGATAAVLVSSGRREPTLWLLPLPEPREAGRG